MVGARSLNVTARHWEGGRQGGRQGRSEERWRVGGGKQGDGGRKGTRGGIKEAMMTGREQAGVEEGREGRGREG